jgi:hypothetical protein
MDHAQRQWTEDKVRKELVKPEYERLGYAVKVEANEASLIKSLAMQGIQEAQDKLARLN